MVKRKKNKITNNSTKNTSLHRKLFNDEMHKQLGVKSVVLEG